MTEPFALGVDGTVVNLRHVKAIQAQKVGEQWRVLAIIEPDKNSTMLAGPFDTQNEAIQELGWIVSLLGAKSLWR